MIYIGGGTGFVGTALLRLLRYKGHKCTVVSRTQQKPTREAASFLTCITWDEFQREGLSEDCVGVVNLSGANLMDMRLRWDEDYKRSVRHSRIWTTTVFARLIAESTRSPSAFVCSSGVGYYPPSVNFDYNEGFKPSPGSQDFFSQLCHDWEAASVLPPDCPTRVCNVRTGVVLGRTGGMIANLIYPFYFGLGGRMGSGRQWLPWVHLDDVVHLIYRLLTTDNCEGPFNAVAPEPSTNSDFVTAFATALHRPALFPVPEFVMNRLMGAERATVVLQGQKVCPKRTLESGYQFKYPTLESACAELARLSWTAQESEKLFL